MGVDKKDFAEILLGVEAVEINPVTPFKYASGLLSPIYTNCRKITYFQDERREVVKGLIEKVKDRDFDVVAGTASSGISLATYLSSKLNLPMVYVRSTSKRHGKENQIEGEIEEGSKVLLVSDIISTEKDIPRSVEAIESSGSEVTYCVTIFNNELGEIEEFLKDKDIPFSSLTDLTTVLKVAYKNKKINKREKEIVEEWIEDPEKWDERRKKKIKKQRRESKREIAEILLDIEAVTLNLEDPYRYASGILSPIYIDNRILQSYPEKWRKVIEAFVNIAINDIGLQNIDVIAGTATAGVSHAAYAAEELNLPMIYVKSEKDEEGNKKMIVEGPIESEDRVLLIEDLISTGGSALSAVEGIRDKGAKVDHCISIFTYETEKSKKAFEESDVELNSLTNISTLLQVASEQDYIKPEEREKVVEWTKNPSEWGSRMGYE